MNTLPLLLIFAAGCCALVAGITLIFAIVVMPGLQTLGDRAYLEAFKAIDRVIQNNQPVFVLVWMGSALSLIIATALGVGELQGINRALLIAALIVYLPGVQVSTAVVNVPLNNQLQAHDLDRLNDAEVATVREDFEARWLRWNTIRTWLSTVTTVLLLILLLRI